MEVLVQPLFQVFSETNIEFAVFLALEDVNAVGERVHKELIHRLLKTEYDGQSLQTAAMNQSHKCCLYRLKASFVCATVHGNARTRALRHNHPVVEMPRITLQGSHFTATP